MKKRYTWDKGKAILAKSVEEAAAIAARRLAHQEYGRAGHGYVMREESCLGDGAAHTYDVWVGYPRGAGSTGKNLSITVYPPGSTIKDFEREIQALVSAQRPYWNNVVMLNLQQCERSYGKAATVALMKRCNLDRHGWKIPEVESKT